MAEARATAPGKRIGRILQAAAGGGRRCPNQATASGRSPQAAGRGRSCLNPVATRAT